jgi:hypothetical protein
VLHWGPVNRFTVRPQLQKFLSHIAGDCSVRKCHDQTILAVAFHGQYLYRFGHEKGIHNNWICDLFRFARFSVSALFSPAKASAWATALVVVLSQGLFYPAYERFRVEFSPDDLVGTVALDIYAVVAYKGDMLPGHRLLDRVA